MNQERINLIIKRAVFMLATMLPIVIVLSYTGNNSTGATAITGGILAAISMVVYPDKPRTPAPKEPDKKK